jgi:hypothetical protein
VGDEGMNWQKATYILLATLSAVVAIEMAIATILKGTSI